MQHNRWFVVLGSLLIQISLGAIYIYSVFKPALKDHFPNWSATDIALPAQILLSVGAVFMIAAGKIQDKFGPKKTAIAGGFTLLLGMYVAAKAQTLAQFVFGFGVLGGIGIYAAYVCPIAACAKWFPDKRGLITGLAVAGFGAGGLIFAPLAAYFIVHLGIMAALFYLGLVYFCAIFIGAQFLRVPPADYCPSGWTPLAQSMAQEKEFTVFETIKRKKFWLLWFTYFIGAAAGLMVIMNLVNIWQSLAMFAFAGTPVLISKNEFARILTQGALAVMMVSVFNSAGRIIWGRISDKNGREKTLVSIFALCGISLLVLAGLNGFWSFIVAVSIVGFCFGGFLAVYPAITADCFGVKNIGANYGLMFTAYGAGGILGPWLAPKLMAAARAIPYETANTAGTITVKIFEAGKYDNAYFIAGFLCLSAALLIKFFSKKLL